MRICNENSQQCQLVVAMLQKWDDDPRWRLNIFRELKPPARLDTFFPKHNDMKGFKCISAPKKRERGRENELWKVGIPIVWCVCHHCHVDRRKRPKTEPVYADDALKGNIRQSATGKGVWPLPCRCLVPIWLICQRGVLIMMWGFQGFIDTLRFKCQSW